MVMFAWNSSLNIFAFIHYSDPNWPFLSICFFLVVFSVTGQKMCGEIYGYFTIMLEQLSMFIGGVFKLELFLPEEYPMAAPKVCWNCVFTQDNII
jgi:hypothetical protein